MSLVKCPDCGRMISDLSSACIGCGRPTSTISIEPPSDTPPPIKSNSVGKPIQLPEEQKRTISDTKEGIRAVTKEKDLVSSVSEQAVSNREEQSRRSEMLTATTWLDGLSPADRKRFEALAQMTTQQRKDSCFACNGQKGVCHTCNSREEGYKKYILATGIKPTVDIPMSIRSRKLEPPMHFKVRAKGFDYSGGTLEDIQHRIAIGELPEDVWLMGNNSTEWRRPSGILRGEVVTAQKQTTAGTPAQTTVTDTSRNDSFLSEVELIDNTPLSSLNDLPRTPPSREMAWGNPTTSITIKKTSVFLSIVFTLITAGIYYPAWFLTRRQAINSLNSKEKLGTGVFVFGIVIFSLSLVLMMFSGFFEGLNEVTKNPTFLEQSKMFEAVDKGLSLIVGITLLVQCFKVRRIFRDHFNVHLKQDITWSGVMIFFFQIYYLQYKVNRVEYGMAPARR